MITPQSQLNKIDEFLAWNFGPQDTKFWDDVEEILKGNNTLLDVRWAEAQWAVEDAYPDMGMASMEAMKERFGPWDGPEEWRYAARLEEAVRAATKENPWD